MADTKFDVPIWHKTNLTDEEPSDEEKIKLAATNQ